MLCLFLISKESVVFEQIHTLAFLIYWSGIEYGVLREFSGSILNIIF